MTWTRAARAEQSQSIAERAVEDITGFANQYCIDCHNSADRTAGLALDDPSLYDIARNAQLWEKIVRRLSTRQMPPPDASRPDEAAYTSLLLTLTGVLDTAAADAPNPGRTDTWRRLNRTEYKNAIRDLLHLDIDVAQLLPGDESSHGFDNVTVGTLSPTLLERYITAAQEISKQALGLDPTAGSKIVRLPADLTQEQHVVGLPLGTRGGTLIAHTFPQDGQYVVQIRLARDRNEQVEGLNEPHELVVLLDRRQVAQWTVAPPQDRNDHETVDEHLKVQLTIPAGVHHLGVTFLKNPSSLLETKRQPYDAHFNMHRHPRISPAIYQIAIQGPLEATKPGDTPSRRRILAAVDESADDEENRARQILATIARRAYRRPVVDADLERPMHFFRDTRSGEDFEAALAMALSSVLVHPEFLWRIERQPEGIAADTTYRITDIELASRLSFFLWSSIPDDELLNLAEERMLSQPDVLERQVRRMLADKRAESLVTNFADQWLYLRNLDSATPDQRLFPDFDHNLRQALRAETELLMAHVIRDDASVLELLAPDHVMLNERLAKHYGIPHVYGSRFRAVLVSHFSSPDHRRGGLLRQGSILTVTSYATRTSPVKRGQWILENILGTPTPPPPADVPALTDNTTSSNLTVRERLAEHRAHAACASCHNLMDPIGLSLENYDAVGRWRTMEEDRPVDAAGGFPDGSQFVGIIGLEHAVLEHRELFVRTLTEKLMTFALGRGLQYYDAPAIRQIVRQAEADNYRFSTLIVALTRSVPFQMRSSQ